MVMMMNFAISITINCNLIELKHISVDSQGLCDGLTDEVDDYQVEDDMRKDEVAKRSLRADVVEYV